MSRTPGLVFFMPLTTSLALRTLIYCQEYKLYRDKQPHELRELLFPLKRAAPCCRELDTSAAGAGNLCYIAIQDPNVDCASRCRYVPYNA